MSYEKLLQQAETILNIEESSGVLHWDQQVMMPEKGIQARASQTSTLSRIAHQKLVSEETAEAIENTDPESLGEAENADLREMKRRHQRARKVPEELQTEISEKSSETVEIWKEAREEDNFEKVKEDLRELVELKRRYAQEIDPEREPYAVLFDDYEPYIDFDRMETVLETLRDELTDLLEKIDAEDVEDHVFTGEFPRKKQEELFRSIVGDMGFDWDSGRLDVSAHPFTSGNQFDARITTRYSEENLKEGLMASIHEAGHALYEQGLPEDLYGQPSGNSRDLSVHESQSRIWENNIGRSRQFWEYLTPKLKEEFPQHMEDVSSDQAFRAVNRIDPGNLIRIEADELSYHLHIVIRFEIERDLINGEIEVEDLPETWNRLYREYLGVEPETDAEGVLQDIHWFQGSIGYFPTYSLGSVLAAQLEEAMGEDLDDMDQHISQGKFDSVLNWLRENVHSNGCIYETEDLIEEATGEELSAEPFLRYIREKYGRIYDM